MKSINDKLADYGYTSFKEGQAALALQLKIIFVLYMVFMFALGAFGLYMTTR